MLCSNINEVSFNAERIRTIGATARWISESQGLKRFVAEGNNV